MSKDSPTNGELKIMMDNLTTLVQEMKAIIIDDNKKTDEMKTIVAFLSDRHIDINKALFDDNNGLVTWRERMWGWLKGVTIGVSILMVVVPILFTLYIKSLKTDIIDEASYKVVSTLEARYDTAIK